MLSVINGYGETAAFNIEGKVFPHNG
ncbi:hypothetical protein CGLO_18283 [Colletotrichum gloeosporioides Cg-14]|uniref:Uncharacterized protein n=1 Tax=Colletotrichum gloeosporioides (strain Cg-14) TaxID=1237896 RepID=T0JUU7_COLGC|nr:hypothetical protein CGLO_18283 [Colletotrichum gloeosporioides Cg-14]